MAPLIAVGIEIDKVCADIPPVGVIVFITAELINNPLPGINEHCGNNHNTNHHQHDSGGIITASTADIRQIE